MSQKTMAIRLDQGVADLLALVAQLEGTTIIDQIRVAIDEHLKRKSAEGDLAERAKAVLDEIDREASARKEAISTLFATKADSGEETPKSGSRRRSSTKPEEGRVIPMGFAPPPRDGNRRSGK